MENKKLQTGGETTNTDSSNDFFNYVDNIFKTQILPKKDIEPALPKIEDLDIDLDLIKKVDEPDLGWKSAKEEFLTDTFEIGTSDEELKRIKNFDFSLRDGDNRYQRRYDNMNWGSNLLRTVGNYAATGMEIATGMAGGLWEGGEELVDEVSEQTGLDIYNNKEFGKNWLLSASDWLRESKPEIYDRDGVEQGEGNFWEQLKDIKSLDLGDIYKAGSVLPSVFGSMAVAIPLTAVIMPSSIAAGAAVGGVPGAVVGGFMGKTVVAAALAYAEGMMDAKDVYKEKYDEIFEKTMDVNYAENVAKTAANKNLLYNTALNTPLNLIEVGFLTKYLKKPAFKSFDTFNPDKLHGRYKPTLLAGETTEDYIARMARNEIRDSSGNVIGYKSNLNRSFTEFLKDIPDDIGYNIRNKKEFIGRHYDDILSPLSEGLEEYNNFWSREKGMENVDTKLSIAGMLSDGTSYLPEFAQNMKEGEGVFDILSGMLGAVVTNPIMTNVHIKRDKIYDPISNTYKFKYDRSDLNPFKETDFFQFGKKEADKKDMKSYIERSIDNIRTTKKLFSDFNNSPDIETKSHLLDQMMIQPITEAISSNTLNTKIATYQEGLNMLQEKRNEPLENKLDFLSTTDKTNVQNLMLKLSTASEQVEIDTINGQLDNYNKTANKHIELQSKTIKENIDYLNQLNTAYVSLYSQKQTENDYGYLNELFKAQFSYDQELKFRTKLERDLESRITELTSLAPNKNEALMSLENDTEFNQAQDNLLASEIRAMQFGARLNMLRRGEFLEDTHNILEQDLIDKIETYKIDSPEILAYKKYVRLKSLPERFQESIKGELKRMEENELKSFFEFKNNYNQLIELQNKKAKEDNESAIYKYIKRSQKVADLHHKLAKNKVEFDNFYKLIDSTSAYFKYFTEFGDFGYDELISNLTSQLAMKDWYSNYLTFYNAVIQDIELFEVNNPTLSSDYKGRIIHLKKQIKTNHLRITQFYIIQSTKFKKRNTIDDILGYLNSNQKPVSGKLPWNYEDLLNNIKSEFGITVDEDGTYQTNRVNYVIQYEDKFHIAKNESKKIEYDFNTNSFISVEYINEFKRNDPKLIVISKRTTPLNYNDDYIDLSSGTLLKDFLKENGLTLTLVNEYNIDVVNGVNLNIFTEDKDNKKRQLIFIKEALASKDKSPDISKLSNDSKDIYNKIKKALEDTTNSLVLSDSGNTPIDRNNLDNIIEIMQNDLTLEIINERFTEEEIKDMMEGKDEAIENIIKVLTDGELPDTKNLREIYNKYFKEIDGIKSAFIDDDEYDIKESYNKWGGILITHIFKSIESMDLKSKIDIAHRLRKSIGSENADSVKDLHYQLFFYYIGDEKILSEIKDELIHNINDMKKSVFEIEPELIDGDYDKIINGNEKEVEGLIESYQGFYKAIKFINKLRQIEGELFSDFDRIIDEENQIFNDKDKTLLKARFNKDKLNEYYDNWINSLGVRVTPKDVVEDVKDLTVTNTPIPPTTNTPVPPTTSNQSEIEAKKADIERRRQGLNGVEEIIFSNPNFRLEGFEIDGNYWNVVTSTDRAKVLVNVNGVIVPFYLTTGQAGKGLIPGWYPFFGIGKDGWLNKTDKSDMETYYERYWGKEIASIVKFISEELNSFYGTDPSVFKNDGDPNANSRPLTTLADKVEDFINSKLNYTPAINNADARKVLRNNIEQLGKEISNKYGVDVTMFPSDKVKLEDLETPEVENNLANKKADIERRRQEEISNQIEDAINIRNSKTKDELDKSLMKAFQEETPIKALNTAGMMLGKDITAKYYNKDYSFKNEVADAIESTQKNQISKINAKYDAELKALEQQPTTSNQSEIEAKKADIERRRQEELLKIGNEAIPKEVQEFINIDNSGKKVKVTYVPVAGKSLAVVLIDWFSRNIPNVKIKNYKFIGDSIQVDITLEGLGNWQTWELPIVSTIGGSGSFIEVNLSEWGKTLINAKYDAELAAEAKKADIERRNTFTRKDLKTISEGTALAKKGSEVIDTKKVESTLSIGDKITFFAEKERKGIWDGKAVRDEKDNPWGLIGILGSNDGWLRNDTKYDAELKALGQQQENLQKEENKRQEIKRQEEELNRLIAIEEAQKEQEKAAEAEAEKQQKLRDLHNDVSFSLGFFETADKQKNLIKLMRANQTKIDPNSNFKFEINSVIYDSIEELFKHDSSYINLNSTIKVLDEKDNVIKEIPLTVNNKLIKDILLDDDILIRDMMSKRREEVLKLLTNTSSTDPIKYNFNKLVKLIEFEYLFGIFEIDDIEHYDTYNKVVLFLNKLKGSGDIIVDTSTNVPSFKFNIGTKNEKNYDGLKIPEDVEIFQLVQLKDTELKKAFYENYKYEDKYYYDEKTNKLTFKNKNDFNKVRAGYYTEDDGTNSEFPYAKTRKIFPSVIDWALYKKNPLLYLKHKKRGINLDGETNLINSTSLKFNTDAYKNKLIKSFQLLKSTPKIFEFTYKDSTETEIRIRIEKSENGEFTVITDLDEKSGLSRHEILKVDGTYTFYLDDNKENMLFQIIENKVETSSFKYENAKKVLDDIIKEMTDENNIAEWEDEKFSRFYSDIDVTMYNKFLYVIRELRANLFLLGNPIIKDIIYYFTDFGDSIYLDSNRNAVKFEFRNELPYDIPINNLIDFTRSLFEDFNLDDFNVVVKGLSEVKLESLVDIKTLTFYKNQVKHITESESNYLLWLKQYFYYLHKYNPNKQREIQVGNKLYKLNDSVRLKDSKNLVHITDISNENGIPKFNNVVFDSDLHEAEVFSENDNELINGDKIYIFKNNEWRIKSEGDIEEIDEDLRNLLEDFRNKEIININNKDKNADLLDNNSVRFVNIINNRLRNDNEKLLINENLIENKINKDTLLKIIQNNKQDILNFVFRKSDSKFDDSDVHIQVPDEDLSNKIKKDALSEENYDALAYVLTNEGKLIPQNGGIVENDFRSFEVDANKINTDIKAFFNGEILNFKENGKAIIEVRSVKVTTKFEEISIGDNNSLELLVTSNAVELFILINHYLDPKGELDLLNNLNEKDVNELKTKANIYARIRILLDGVGIDQPIEKYIKDNFEDIHTLYKNVIQVVQIETDEVETDKSVHLGYLHDLTHYFKSNDIEKAYSMIVNYYNKVLSKFIKNDFQLKFKVRIENEGYLIASDKEDSFLVNYPKITKVYRFKGHGKDVKLHEFDVKNGKFKQVLLDVFEEKELKAIITEFLLIEDSNTDKVPDKEDLILMIETYLKNKDTINTAFFTILDNQFSFNKRILKLNNNKWDSIKENDKNLYQHYFDLFLGTLQKGTTNENIKSIIDNLFILYKDYGVSESEYANDKSKKKIELLLSKIDNESYYKNIVLPIYVVKNGNDFVFKLIGKIGNMIHVLELTRNGGHITYKMLKYDIGTEKLAENIQDDLAKTTPLDKDGYIAWLKLMFPYIPIDIDMASFNKVDFGGSEIERFKLSYFTNTKSIEGNNFTNPLVKLDLREVEPYKTKSDKVDSAKIIDENITTKNLNLRTSLTELSSNTKGFSKGDVDSVILKILNVTSTQNEEAFNLILNEFKPLQVILQDFEGKIKITSISQTTFINNFKEFFKKNRGNINQFLIEKSNGDDSNNIESCI